MNGYVFFYSFINLFEFTSVTIRRRNLPIKIALIENFLNGMIGNKSNFFSVEATEKRRRSDFVKGSRFADGQDELREHIANVGNIGFCFCPEEVLLSAVCRLAGLTAKSIFSMIAIQSRSPKKSRATLFFSFSSCSLGYFISI